MSKQVGLSLNVEANGAIKAFDDVGRSMNSVSRIAKTITNDGADLTTIYKRLGEVGGQSFTDVISAMEKEGKSLQEIKKAVLDLAATQRKAAQEAKGAILEEAQAEAILTQRSAERAAAVAQAMGSMNAQAKAFVGGLMEAGKELGTLTRQMNLAFGDPKMAKGAIDAIRDLDDNTGIAEQSLASAAITMQKFGAYSDENLQRAAIASKKTGQSIESIAEAIGKYQKFGDSRSQMALKKLLGLDDKDIADAGGALEALDKKFGTTTDGMTSAAQRAKGEIEDLRQEIGVQTVKALNDAVGAALPFAQQLHQMPDAMKGAIGTGAALFSGITSIGSAALSVAAQMKMAELSFSGLAAAATGPLGLILAAITAVAAAGGALILHTQIQTEKTEKETQEWEALNKVLREHKDIRDAIASGKPIDDIGGGKAVAAAWEGKAEKVKKEIETLSKERAELEKGYVDRTGRVYKGDTSDVDDQIKKKLQLLEMLQKKAHQANEAVAGAQGRQSDSNADTAAAKNGIAAWDNYRKRVANGFYETKEEQLKALNEVAQKVQHNGKAWTEEELKKHGIVKSEATKLIGAYEDVGLQRIRLEREVGKEKEQASKKATQDALRDGLHAIDMEEGQHKLSHQDKIARLNALMAKLGGDKEIRIQLEKMIANEAKAAHSEASRAAEKAAEDAQKRAEKRLAAEQDLAAKMKALAGETTADKLREVDKQVDAYRKAGVNEVEIAKWAKAAKADIEKRDAEKKLDEHQKTVSAQDQLAKDREDDLKEQMQKGTDTSDALKASVNSRYEHEKDAIRQKAALNKDDAEAQAQAAAQISHLDNQQAKEIREIIKLKNELIKKAQEEKAQASTFKTGAQSVADAFSGGFGGFGSTDKKPSGGDNPGAAPATSSSGGAPPVTTGGASTAAASAGAPPPGVDPAKWASTQAGTGAMSAGTVVINAGSVVVNGGGGASGTDVGRSMFFGK